MSNLQDNLLSSYDYSLDSSFIAQSPVEPRHLAKLLVVDECNGNLRSSKHKIVWDWADDLRKEDLIILNDTKVIKARLRVRRPGGGLGELLLLEPLQDGLWLCLAKPGKRMRPGDNLFLDVEDAQPISLEIVANHQETGGRIVRFPSEFSNRKDIEIILDKYGEVPLPPYIQKINSDIIDADRYQTRYAMNPGAIAAPTAGLHLSDQLLNALTEKGIKQKRITLHIGLGTFKPVDVEDLKRLKLHREWVEVNEEVVESISECRSRGGKVIAVGTTTVRALESAYLAGGCNLQPFRGYVDLAIKPGYRFGVVDGLLTNFHLPKTSLLFLVSAFIGRRRLLELYSLAKEHNYRFYSYGDAMWIKPEAVIKKARPPSNYGD